MRELWACELGKPEESPFYRLLSEMSPGPPMTNYAVVVGIVLIIYLKYFLFINILK
jgi:hypothetical protein